MSPAIEARTPTTLDTMYRPGASTAFQNTLDLSSVLPGVVVSSYREGGLSGGPVMVQVEWSLNAVVIGSLGVQFFPTYLQFDVLALSTAQQEAGVFRHMIETELELFASWGVQTMVCSPFGEESQKALERFGYQLGVWNGERRLIVPTSGGRMSEYLTWLRGGAEPPWRKQIA